MKLCSNCRFVYYMVMNRPDAPCVDCVGHDKWQTAKPNNYDKVRAMTMEELAEKIGESIDCEVCKTMHHSESVECPSRPHQSCVDFWLDWLKQEAIE